MAIDDDPGPIAKIEPEDAVAGVDLDIVRIDVGERVLQVPELVAGDTIEVSLVHTRLIA